MKLHQHVGSAPLHRRVARQVRVTSPVMLYPVLQAYVTVSWYRLPVTTELPFLRLPGSPQFTPVESSITKSEVISCCWTNYSLPLRFRQISVKNFTVSVSIRKTSLFYERILRSRSRNFGNRGREGGGASQFFNFITFTRQNRLECLTNSDIDKTRKPGYKTKSFWFGKLV